MKERTLRILEFNKIKNKYGMNIWLKEDEKLSYEKYKIITFIPAGIPGKFKYSKKTIIAKNIYPYLPIY